MVEGLDYDITDLRAQKFLDWILRHLSSNAQTFIFWAWLFGSPHEQYSNRRTSNTTYYRGKGPVSVADLVVAESTITICDLVSKEFTGPPQDSTNETGIRSTKPSKALIHNAIITITSRKSKCERSEIKFLFIYFGFKSLLTYRSRKYRYIFRNIFFIVIKNLKWPPQRDFPLQHALNKTLFDVFLQTKLFFVYDTL